MKIIPYGVYNWGVKIFTGRTFFDMKIINLESGMPDVSTALSRLQNGLYAARATGDRQAKIIHGYGSTGRGGAIRSAVRSELRSYRRRGVIKAFCPGEEFGPFSQGGRDMVFKDPSFKNDRDWARSNDGITIVSFR